MSVRVSVVVPAYKRPQLLARCLEALVSQRFDRRCYEIIVADDGPTADTERVVASFCGMGSAEFGMRSTQDVRIPHSALRTPHSGAARSADTERVVASFCGMGSAEFGMRSTQDVRTPHSALRTPHSGAARAPRVRYLPVTDSQGPAGARNRGWRAASGEIIAFTDDDCIPDSGWLEAGVAAFVDDVAGVWGRLVMPLPPRPTDYEYNAGRLETAEFATANCFYRRAALADAGGFDERFKAAWCEDSDLLFTMIERGMRLVHAREAIVVHPLRPARWGISLEEQRKSMFNALLYKKHPELYRRRMPKPFCWDYYFTVAALLGALGSAASGRRKLAAGAAAVWALLTGRFCARRLRHASRAPGHIAEMALTSSLIPPLSVFWRIRGALRYRVPFL